MGRRLKELYAQAEQLGGLNAKIRLATMTRIASTQAELEPDSPATVERFTQALATIAKELGRKDAQGTEPRNTPSEMPAAPARPDRAAANEERLRLHCRTTVDLLSQRSLFLGDVERTLARVTEAAAKTLEVARASVWFYDDAHSLLRCADLYELGAHKHSSGVELKAEQFPLYFQALRRERSIPAHDACADPRTAEFAQSYLQPLGITSMLDVPIWVYDKMVGVVCHEHVGARRVWDQDEENFAYSMALFVAISVEHRKA